jgi:hypothetical protein
MGAVRGEGGISPDLRITYVPLETVRKTTTDEVGKTTELIKILP